ncbi:MAG: asparagine synthetase B, partial [Desulfobulbaceae bacterium]|nr:asparagine synthetase B [Desulfobulbaceae bacterium]
MIGTLLHWGPDYEGVWVDTAIGVAIGHRRLSVLDISTLGRQPMLSASGRYAIVYNGEIYNFKLLRRELEEKGRKFTSTSDTEVLLAAVEEWGLTA